MPRQSASLDPAASAARLDRRLAAHPATIAAALALLTFALFSRSIAFGFVNYDDDVYVYENRHVLEGLSWDSFLWAFKAVDGGNWHPITWLSFLLDVSLGAGQPWAFHLTSVILHALCVAVLFLGLRLLTGATWPAAAVALLWGLHPLRVESVAWVSERKDVLSGLFWMLTLLAYAYYAKAPTWGRYLLVVVALSFGLMSKPMLVTLPCVLLVLDIWPLRRMTLGDRSSWKKPLLEKALLLPVIVAFCILTFVVQRQTGMMMEGVPLAARAANALVAYAAYLRLMFWPMDLAVLYPYPQSQWPALFHIVLSGVLLTAITTLAAWAWRRDKPWFLIGWVWYLGTLVPVIGLVQVGWQSMADRYTYIPMIGPLVAVVWGMNDLSRRHPLAIGRLAPAAMAIVLMCCAAMTWSTLGHWENSISLWQQVVRVTPKGARPKVMLANALVAAQKPGEALDFGRQALDIDPNMWLAQHVMGIAHIQLGQEAQALPYCRRAAQIEPDNPQSWLMLAMALERLNRLDEALAAYQRAAQADPSPENWAAFYEAGRVLARLDRHAEAIEPLSRATALFPQNAPAQMALAASLTHLGRDQQAKDIYLTLLAMPDAQGQGNEKFFALDALGILEARSGRFTQAAQYFAQATALAPSDPMPLNHLALMLEKTGDYHQAAAIYARALRLNPSNPDARAGLSRLTSPR